ERLAPRLVDPGRVAQMHMNVARLYLAEGRIEDAERSLGRAEDLYRQLDLMAEIGGAHLARGYVLSRQGRLPEARRELEEALATFEETGDVADRTRTLNELARVERLEGRPDRARELLERSISLLGTRDAPILGWAHRELGVVLSPVDPAAAEKHLRIAIDVFERTQQPVDLAIAHRALGDLLAAGGDEAAAGDAYRTGILALERLV
ncbi:MAG TPA: tetratricopeptide repeat protein, partial [Actinomycetota bacterium]